MFNSPLLQSKAKPCCGQGKMLPVCCESISLASHTAPPALCSSGDERSPWHSKDALLETSVELVVMSVRGTQRSRAFSTGLPG